MNRLFRVADQHQALKTAVIVLVAIGVVAALAVAAYI
jgi:hypothetical protein